MNDEMKIQLTNNKQFVYPTANNSEKYFRIRHSDIVFHSLNSKAWILQDETDTEELKRLDEKYKHLYLASIVHDIRTPIHGILGMLEMIEATALNNNEIQRFISVARHSAKLLLFYTHDIIDYSQIEAKTISVNNESFSLSDAISECIQIYEFCFLSKGIQLHKFIDQGIPCEIISDKMRYMQIVLNLLGNAFKYTFEGEVELSVRYDETADVLITKISDTGMGIKQEDMPKLFKLFSKARNNSEVNPTGIGLGLSICKKLSQLLGGDIIANSIYGKGSTFTFSIKCNLQLPQPMREEVTPYHQSAIAEEHDSFRMALPDSRTFVVRESILTNRRSSQKIIYEVF